MNEPSVGRVLKRLRVDLGTSELSDRDGESVPIRSTALDRLNRRGEDLGVPREDDLSSGIHRDRRLVSSELYEKSEQYHEKISFVPSFV